MRKFGFLLIFVVLSCDPSKGPVNPPVTASFKLNGIFVRDVNRLAPNGVDSVPNVASFQLLRNDSLFKLAAARIGVLTDTTLLDATDSGYFKESPLLVLRPGQNHTLSADYSPNQLNFSTSLVMPDTFGFTNIQPGNRLATGGNGVSAEWTASANASGYIVAIVHDDSSLSSQVDTSFFPDFATSTAVSPFAFRDANDQPVAGLYRIYVISFRGGFYAYPGMPFPLLRNYSPVDTSYSSTVSGRAAAAFVAAYDTIRVP